MRKLIASASLLFLLVSCENNPYQGQSYYGPMGLVQLDFVDTNIITSSIYNRYHDTSNYKIKGDFLIGNSDTFSLKEDTILLKKIPFVKKAPISIPNLDPEIFSGFLCILESSDGIKRDTIQFLRDYTARLGTDTSFSDFKMHWGLRRFHDRNYLSFELMGKTEYYLINSANENIYKLQKFEPRIQAVVDLNLEKIAIIKN